jgi:transcriptional regulator with XRE-family HTH domain
VSTIAYTNEELARVLRLSTSSASRMRTGIRTGSVETLQRLAFASDRRLEEVAAAAAKARSGPNQEIGPWLEILAAAVARSRRAA